ncbi:MAG: hypothetical protein ACPHY8_05535 [Patescibacteria group bacterium]
MISQLSGLIYPAIILANVDFPEPESQTRANTFSHSIFREKSVNIFLFSQYQKFNFSIFISHFL